LKSLWYLLKLGWNSWKDHWTWSRFIITLSSNKKRNISQLHGCVAVHMNEYMGTLALNNLLLPPPPPHLACPSLASSSSLLEPVRPGAMSPDRALCLPTFSHFLIVNKTSLPLSSPIHIHTQTHTHTLCVYIICRTSRP
jgi:hypothetical protein